MSFDVGSIQASLTLDRTPFSNSLNAAEADGREFASKEFVASLDLDLSKLKEAKLQAQAELASIGNEEIKLKVVADTATIQTTKAQLKGIADETVNLEVKPDTSSLRSASAELLRWKTQAEADPIEPKISPDVGSMRDELTAAKIIAAAAERGMKMEPEIDPDIKPWQQKSAFIKRDASVIKRLDPSVVFGAINDPFMFVAKETMGLVKDISSKNGVVTFKSRGGQKVQADAKAVQKSIEGMFDALARVENLTGRDGSLTRSMGGAIGKIVTMGSAAVGTAGDVAKLAASAADAAGGAGSGGVTALGSAAGGAGGKIVMMGASAGATAASLGLLASAVMPLLAILATGLGTVAALGVGLGVMGAAAFGVAKDYGAVSSASRAVENAQIKLDAAMKAAGEEQKKLAPITKELTTAEKAQKTAKDQLSKAWDRLEAARNPNNAKAVAGAEKEITDLEKKQKAAAEATSKAWDKLGVARDAEDTRGMASAEKALNAAQGEQEKNATQLDTIWKRLAAARKSGNAKEVAAQERNLANAEADQEAITRKLDAAYSNLEKARDAGKPKAIAAAEKELAAAQKKEEGITKQLDKAHSSLDKTRNPKNAQAIAAAEKDIAKWEAEVEKTTTAVEKAQTKLNEARKSGSSARVKIAQKELAAAQNDQALALKRAAGNSDEYKKALKDLHTEGKKLGPTFQKAFNDAKVEAAKMATELMRWTNQILPAMGQAADKSFEEFQTGFSKGYSKGSTFKELLDKLPPVMGDFGGVTRNVGSAFNTFMDVAMPHIKNFTQWLEDASNRLAEWADSKQGRDDIKSFLDLAVPMAQKLGEFFKKVGARLFELAEDHGPLVIDFLGVMVESVDAVAGALDAALDIATKLLDTWKSVNEWAKKNNEGNSKKGHQLGPGGPANPSHAYGGDTLTMAMGGDANIKGKNPLHIASHGLEHVGAHYVQTPTTGRVGAQEVLYGEALSGSSREYAFPMGRSGFRFITEQPGFDRNSYNLWRDLGQRKGYLRQNTPPQTPKARSFGSSGSAQRPPAPAPTSAAPMGGLETEPIVAAIDRNTAATEAIPEGVREGQAHNLQHGRKTRGSAMKGLSRETRRRVFEGTL